MANRSTFDDILEAVDHLSPDDQADLVAVIQRRLAERGRQQVVSDVREGRADYQAGRAAPAGVDDLMREIDS